MRNRPFFPRISSRASVLLAAVLFLAACAEGQFAATGAPGAATTTVELIEQEVEKPDVFQVIDRALWDGRPSLGGLWVAHAGADKPERVIIVNTETGAEIKGALFRRERDNPGPAFQLSSSAAAALGILAGVPTKIRVTAIRLETIEVVTNVPAPQIDPAAEDTDTQGSTLEPITASEILAVPSAPAPPKPQPRKTEKPAPEAPSEPADTAEPAKPVAAAEPAESSPPATAGTAVPAKPYVQVATMSSPERADKLVAELQGSGLKASRKPSGSGDTLKYIVIVGPAATEAKAADNLAKIRGLGFKDAFRSRGR